MRLNYPMNHFSNYLDSSSGFELNSVKPNPKRPPALAKILNSFRNSPKRVLQWIQKEKVINPEASKPDFARGIFEHRKPKAKVPSLAAQRGPAGDSSP